MRNGRISHGAKLQISHSEKNNSVAAAMKMKARKPTLKGRADRHSHFGGCGVARRAKHPFGGGGGGCHTENAQFPAVLFVLLSPLPNPNDGR